MGFESFGAQPVARKAWRLPLLCGSSGIPRKLPYRADYLSWPSRWQILNDDDAGPATIYSGIGDAC